MSFLFPPRLVPRLFAGGKIIIKKKFVVVVAVVLIHFNTLGEERRGIFNPMYFCLQLDGLINGGAY